MGLIALAFVSVLFAEPAAAQQYPPPTPTTNPKPKECAQPGVVIENGGRERFMPQREFHRGDTVSVRGAKNCVPKQTRVDLYYAEKKENPRIGGSVSSQHGAYTVSGRVPPRTSLGQHKLTIVSAKKRYVTRIEVVAGSENRERTVATGTLLATWAALAAIVGAYALAMIRRRHRPLSATAADVELRVPTIDTWDFVPALAGRRSGQARPSAKRVATKRPAKRAAATKQTKPKTAKPQMQKAKKTEDKVDASKPSAKATPTRRGQAGSKAPKAPKGAADEPTRKPPKK